MSCVMYCVVSQESLQIYIFTFNSHAHTANTQEYVANKFIDSIYQCKKEQIFSWS